MRNQVNDVPVRRLFNSRETATITGISERTLWGIPKEELPRVRIGRKILFDIADVETFIARKKSQTET